MLRIIALAAVLIVPTLALTAVTNQLSERRVEPKDETASREAAAKLDVRLPEVKLLDVGLQEAIDRLRDMTGANIFVNWKAMESGGVDRHAKVSLHKKNVKLSAVLDMLLAQAAEDAPLGWAIDDGTIVVSTRRDVAAHSLQTRVYDVRDLLRGAKDDSRAKRVDALIKFVANQVDPASWRSHGGDAGVIRELEGQLIVTQSAENHRQLIKLLDGMRGWMSDGAANQAEFPLLKKKTLGQ
jgi:hypothetical protein